MSCWWSETKTLGEMRGYQGRASFLEFMNYRRDVYSQNGEDGIIEKILDLLNIDSGWACEFGAWDGVYLSNAYNLVQSRRFKALMIEGNPTKYQDLVKTAEENDGKILPVNCYVGDGSNPENSLDSILENNQVPRDFDLLSIDIDSYDYLVWKSLTNYKPKVVVIEINSGLDPKIDTEFNHLYELHSGAPYLSMLKLAEEKGYTLICHTGNMIFLRADLIEKLGYTPPEKILDPFLNFWRS